MTTPKFKVGDWVTIDGADRVERIVEVVEYAGRVLPSYRFDADESICPWYCESRLRPATSTEDLECRLSAAQAEIAELKARLADGACPAFAPLQVWTNHFGSPWLRLMDEMWVGPNGELAPGDTGLEDYVRTLGHNELRDFLLGKGE